MPFGSRRVGCGYFNLILRQQEILFSTRQINLPLLKRKSEPVEYWAAEIETSKRLLALPVPLFLASDRRKSHIVTERAKKPI